VSRVQVKEVVEGTAGKGWIGRGGLGARCTWRIRTRREWGTAACGPSARSLPPAL